MTMAIVIVEKMFMSTALTCFLSAALMPDESE